MRIEVLEASHLPESAALFVGKLKALRGRVTGLSAGLADIDAVASRLTGMRGAAAIDDDRVVGFLAAWFPIAGFRGTERIGAHAPEWAHATIAGGTPAIDRALYRAVSAEWARLRWRAGVGSGSTSCGLPRTPRANVTLSGGVSV